MQTTKKVKIPLFCLLAGLTLAAACSTKSPYCLTEDMRSPVGQWRYTGKVGSSGISSASGVERPAEFEFRVDGTFTALYEPPLPSGLSAATLTGRWSGGKRCPGSFLFSGTEVVTDPRIPRTSVIQIEGDRLVLFGAASGFFDAQYERSDPTALRDASPVPNVEGAAEETPATPSPTRTPGKPTPNPWRGR